MYDYIPIFGPYEIEGNGGIEEEIIDGGTTLLEGWNIEGAGLG